MTPETNSERIIAGGAALSAALERAVSLADDGMLGIADADALRHSVDEYPFFTAASIALLKHSPVALAEESVAQLRRAIALCASDSKTLNYAAIGDAWANFYPPKEEETRPATDDVIDLFLKTYGGCTPEEERQLERMIFNPTPDYAELLARQEQEELPDEADDGEPDSQQARINAFIRSQHPAAHHPDFPEPVDDEAEDETPIERPEHSDDSLLSESLAKIFIKQGRYERAYEIISGISLKFPKKSAYFADQLRFLQKLIINQRRRQELQAGDVTEKL